MTRLLLDPLLLVPIRPLGLDELNMSRFIERLADWAADDRAAVGAATLEEVCAHYAEIGYPETSLASDIVPRYLQREYGRSLNQLLARVVDCAKPPHTHIPSPAYRGPAALGKALLGDLAGSVNCRVWGVATDASHWELPSTSLTLSPGPPQRTELCSVPGAGLTSEIEAKFRAYFADRRVHVVGGRPRDAVPTRLAEILGVQPANVAWMPAEKGKPPRGIRSRWSTLDPDRDITACLTGCIGHAESEVAARAAAARGALHVKAETFADLVTALRDVALRN